MLFTISLLYAEESTDEKRQTSMPSMDFLEFLGEWETEQGEWIDPEELEDDLLENLIETTTAENKTKY